MSRTKQNSYSLSVLFSLCLCACVVNASYSAPPNFADHVVPVLRDKCLGCHNADKARGGLDLTSFGKTMEGGSSGAVVKPGDADASRLYTLTAHKETPKMPPNGPMIAAESLDVLKKWIEGGALETSGSKASVASKPKVDLSAVVVQGRPEGPPPMPGATLPAEPAKRTARAHAALALATNPWSPIVAVAAPKQVLLYNTDNGDLAGVLPFPEGQVHILKFSRNGQLLLAGGGRGGKSGRVVVWKLATGARAIEVGDEHDAVLAADLSPDQTLVALGGPSKLVRIYSAEDGSLVREIKKHTDWVTALEFSPDGSRLASADRAGGLHVWEGATGREQFGLRGHTLMVSAVSWRDDGQLLASASEDGTVRLWELNDGKAIKNWQPGGGILSVRFGHDGTLATIGRDRTARLFKGDGTALKSFEPVNDVGLQVAVTHDGQRVIAGDWTGVVRVFGVADGKRLLDLTTNPAPLLERIALAEQDAKAKDEAVKIAAAKLEQAESAAKSALAELKAAETRIAAANAAAQAAPGKLDDAKKALAQASDKLAESRKAVARSDAKAQATAEAVSKLPTDAPAAKRKSAEEARQAAATARDAAKADLATAEAAYKAATDARTKLIQAMPELVQAAKVAPKDLPDRQKAVQATQTLLQTQRSALEAAKKEQDAANALLVRLRGRTVAVR